MTPELTLGPLLFHWDAETRRDFYARIADEAEIDTVYLGEVICSKRAPLHEHEIPDIAERLARGGKRVVLSSLAEVMLPRERRATAELTRTAETEIEINNAAGLFHANGRAHRLGPFMNVYNAETLTFLAGRGATHVCLPVELPGPAMARMAEAGRQLGVGVEAQVFGRMALAISARCYHARAHGRTKDNCLFVCENDPDGMPLKTVDGQGFLRINGVQTLSESYLSLHREVETLVQMGLTHLRLSPQRVDMVAVAAAFRALLDGRIDGAEAETRLTALCSGAPLANGFLHGEAGYRRIARAAAPA